jgi:hypothetical protein
MNPRIGIAENLPVGATNDLLLVSTPEGYPQGQLFFKFEDTPRKITGIQKVAQLFFKILFSTKGSDPVRPNIGTTFSANTIGANITTNDSVFLATITDAINDAGNQVKGILNTQGSDPASQLSRLSILGITTFKDALGVYVQITTAAGESASVAIPFPELNLPLSS